MLDNHALNETSPEWNYPGSFVPLIRERRINRGSDSIVPVTSLRTAVQFSLHRLKRRATIISHIRVSRLEKFLLAPSIHTYLSFRSTVQLLKEFSERTVLRFLGKVRGSTMHGRIFPCISP